MKGERQEGRNTKQGSEFFANRLGPTKGKPCRIWQRQVFSEELLVPRSHEGCFMDQEIQQQAWLFVFDRLRRGIFPDMGVERWA
ncbi:MAG: hypothetical protein V1878_09855 [bacterium]